MSLYTPDQERAVRLLHHARDWRDSRLISPGQYDRIAADLDTGLRRTNVFLRATLFVFGLLIAITATALVGVMLDTGDWILWLLASMAAWACYAVAAALITKYQLYRFGVEEAFAVAAILFAGLAAGFCAGEIFSLRRDADLAIGLSGAAVMAFLVFFRFGFVYAAIIGMACAAVVPFPLLDSDVASRVVAAAVLAMLFLAARLQHGQHGDEFPGDNYAIVETAAWAAVYLMLNLKISSWLAHPAESGPFYWITYVLIWIMPIAGLWIAVRERHRWLLDVNVVMAIVTMMSNKPYLNAAQQPWDSITFGILMIAIALGVRRWLDGGEGGARNGFVSYRVLASERDRLSAAGNISVMQPSLHPQHAPEQPQPGFGGGGSGGAGGSGKF